MDNRNEVTKDNLTILIIEDQEFFLEVFRIAFSEYNIISASSGEEGLQQFYDHSVDIVVLDICLPDIDGFRVLSEIKNVDPDAFVLIISALNNNDYVKKCKDMGAVGFLGKPYKKEYIEYYIEQYIHNKNTSGVSAAGEIL